MVSWILTALAALGLLGSSTAPCATTSAPRQPSRTTPAPTTAQPATDGQTSPPTPGGG